MSCPYCTYLTGHGLQTEAALLKELPKPTALILRLRHAKTVCDAAKAKPGRRQRCGNCQKEQMHAKRVVVTQAPERLAPVCPDDGINQRDALQRERRHPVRPFHLRRMPRGSCGSAPAGSEQSWTSTWRITSHSFDCWVTVMDSENGTSSSPRPMAPVIVLISFCASIRRKESELLVLRDVQQPTIGMSKIAPEQSLHSTLHLVNVQCDLGLQSVYARKDGSQQGRSKEVGA